MVKRIAHGDDTFVGHCVREQVDGRIMVAHISGQVRHGLWVQVSKRNARMGGQPFGQIQHGPAAATATVGNMLAVSVLQHFGQKRYHRFVQPKGGHHKANKLHLLPAHPLRKPGLIFQFGYKGHGIKVMQPAEATAFRPKDGPETQPNLSATFAAASG